MHNVAHQEERLVKTSELVKANTIDTSKNMGRIEQGVVE